MTALVTRANAVQLPLRDESVDLIVTSPPYFALRSYRDGGEHYDGQIGSEPTPQAFLEALWTVTEECWRVLKPSGSMFVNLGDKRAGSGGHNNNGLTRSLAGVGKGYADGETHVRTRTFDSRTANRLAELGRKKPDTRDTARPTRRNAPDRYNQSAFGRPKSKMMLPHRYAIGCEDGMADPDGVGWIMRQDHVWWKPNGLPESVDDRVRDAHEYWFQLNKDGDYYAAIDEVREPHTGGAHPSGPNAAVTDWESGDGAEHRTGRCDPDQFNPMGKAPSSVWKISSEPLVIPEWLDLEHFAAFPSEWPRRLILGWSPSAICLECGDGRFPVTDVEHEINRMMNGPKPRKHDLTGARGGWNRAEYPVTTSSTQIVGYACACTPFTDHPERRIGGDRNPERTTRGNGVVGGAKEEAERLANPRLPVRAYHLDEWKPAPTRPAVVLDPFGGTGTTAMVARALGRIGISVDLSADYCRLARWRIFDSGHASRVRERRNRELQGALL
jgi:hypothetical protein